MDANFLAINPFRRPQWRADRVIELVDNPKLRPRRSDDSYIRSYRRFQILQKAAGIDKTKSLSAFLAQPHSCVADAIYYGPDTETRHILEARLLSQVSPAEITRQMKIDERAVSHYEALFFDVRHRPHNEDWVREIILGPPEYLFGRLNGAMSDTQRAFLYRLFAYCGGPNVLDAVIQSIAPTAMPESRESVGAWLDGAAEQIVQFVSAAAGRPQLIQDAIVHLLGVALELQRIAKSTKAARRRPLSDFEELTTTIVAKLTGGSTSGSELRRQRANSTSKSQPRVPVNRSESSS